VLVQEGKLASASLPPWWDDFRDALVLVQEEKLAFFSPTVEMLLVLGLARGKCNTLK
jgi:hypothetical protein